jgi:hypothetical protein
MKEMQLVRPPEGPAILGKLQRGRLAGRVRSASTGEKCKDFFATKAFFGEELAANKMCRDCRNEVTRSISNFWDRISETVPERRGYDIAGRVRHVMIVRLSLDLR